MEFLNDHRPFVLQFALEEYAVKNPFVIKKVHLVEKILGQAGIYILRKFFGVILLAMSAKLFITNISSFM